MRTLTAGMLAAVQAVVTSPGHTFFINTTPTPILWSDIGQITLAPYTYQAVDLKVSGIAFNGDGKPTGISLNVGNLDSSIGALLLANDLAATDVYVSGVDRAGLATFSDPVAFGRFNITGAKIGIDTCTINLAPPYYTAPFRRVDAPNGFRFATPAGTQISWGQETLIYNPIYDSMGRRIG
jgi:hypothetical protein